MRTSIIVLCYVTILVILTCFLLAGWHGTVTWI